MASGAPALIETVIARSLVPMLRSEGYRRSGHTFRRTGERCVQVLEVQNDRWNRTNEARFTINLGVYYPEIHAVLAGLLRWQPPASGPLERHCQVRTRIGALRPERSDHWWLVRASEPIDATVASVETDVRTRAMPWLGRAARFDDARTLATGTEAIAFALVAGDREEASASARRFLGERPHATAVARWIEELGLS